MSLGDTSEAFLSYGWCIPFILSAVLVIIGLHIRLKIDETPVFKTEIEDRAATTAPPHHSHAGHCRRPRGR